MGCTCSRNGTCASCQLKPLCHVRLSQSRESTGIVPSAATKSSTCSQGACENFTKSVSDAYEHVVHWKRNLFNIPFGAAGGKFVDELATLIRSFTEPTTSRQIAWKAVCVACHLLLQKPNSDGSTAIYSKHLDRRLSLWRSGRVSELFDESLCIQQHLQVPSRKRGGKSPPSDGLSDTVFSKMVFDGKINSALRYLSQDSTRGGVLNMDNIIPGGSKTVRDVLFEKHPRASVPPNDVLIDEDVLPVNSIVFEGLTRKLIKEVARRSKGAAGPSGLDSAAWKRMLICFKLSSNRLCTALAEAAKVLCTSDVTDVDLSAFTAARLLPLDKKPGVRPIAVGEVFRRIICKAVMRVTQHDVLSCTAPFQLCVGVPSACEAAVHAMDCLFRLPSVQGVLLIDASNAFNALNRTAALHNIPRVCPALSSVFTNTYSKPIRLFVTGGGEISSEEGTCQGDPLAMAIYAVALMPLIQKLASVCPSTIQCWYADDDGAADDLTTLLKYWTALTEIGPGYGYFPNAIKTVLLTKPQYQSEALRLFADTGVMIKSDGCRYLGGAVGEQQFCHSFIQSLAERWSGELRTLARLAQTQPHAAYTCFAKGLSMRWKYHLRCMVCPPEVFTQLDEIINTEFLPALAGREFANEEPDRILLSLPARLGGLAVPILSSPSALAEEFDTSRRITQPLVDLIVPCDPVLEVSTVAKTELKPVSGLSAATPASDAMSVSSAVIAALTACHREQRDVCAARLSASHETAKSLIPHVSDQQQLLLSIAGEPGVSSWLTAEPSYENGLILNKNDFRDAICLRYGFLIDGLPATCVCGSDMTVDHAMTCPCGGYPMVRHNEVRDVVADAMSSAFQDVEVEPVLLPYSGEDLFWKTTNRSEEARVDIRTVGFWTRQQAAFFDIRVTHPRSGLVSAQQVRQQLIKNEREKKRQYAERINTIDRGVFTPLVFSTNGMLGRECSMCLKALVEAIVTKNIDLSYSQVMHHLRCKLSICLLRWSITCLRGCRASFRKQRKNFLAECHLAAPV